MDYQIKLNYVQNIIIQSNSILKEDKAPLKPSHLILIIDYDL